MDAKTTQTPTAAEAKKAACIRGAKRTKRILAIVEELKIENAGKDPFEGLS